MCKKKDNIFERLLQRRFDWIAIDEGSAARRRRLSAKKLEE
jgi:hypothetical protein